MEGLFPSLRSHQKKLCQFNFWGVCQANGFLLGVLCFTWLEDVGGIFAEDIMPCDPYLYEPLALECDACLCQFNAKVS